MYIRLLLLVCAMIFVQQSNAQIQPLENARLNYRLIGFSVKKNIAAATYVFEIANDSITEEPVFQQNIILKVSSATNTTTQTVPAFGKKYTWRAILVDKKGETISKTKLYHFTIGYSNFIDSAKYRFKILTNTTDGNDLLFFSDNTQCIHNLNGEALWYLPEIKGINTKVRIRDLKPTPDGHITFLTDSDACEINYNGKLIWKAPRSASANGNFHHEFTKLNNGHYMVEDYESMTRVIPKILMQYLDPAQVDVNEGYFSKKIQCGTLVEFNAAKKIVWQWNSCNHFTDADYFTLQVPGGRLNSDTHMNGFYFDEKNHFIYISFREISRVTKIKYPSGDVAAQYGNNYSGNTSGGGNFFQSQHHCSLNSTGELCLFNNNRINKSNDRQTGKPISYITILKEPVSASDSIELKWQFPCDIDTLADASSETGGSVYELPNHNLLVSMGSANRCFIVSRDKKVVWNALTEMKIDDKVWSPLANYRISPIENNKQLELLIFNNK